MAYSAISAELWHEMAESLQAAAGLVESGLLAESLDRLKAVANLTVQVGWEACPEGSRRRQLHDLLRLVA